jgi:hypothetical protein
VLTKDRVGAGLAIVAAVLGLALVFTQRGSDDDTPSMPPTGQVAPAPDGQIQQPAPGVSPGQVQQPAAPAQPNTDGDDDDDG